MGYSDTLSYLYGLRTHGVKLGLENITTLLQALGDPHLAFPSVHVAGTNGKGSVSAMAASILRAAGYRVGLFTSPHLVSFTERIRVDSRPVTENEVASLAEEVRRAAALTASGVTGNSPVFSPTFFEVVTAMAMLHFARNRIDFGVIEVGMGGRLDATYPVDSRVSVITRIHVDHRDFLGATIREIAREKAAIMKPGIPAVIAPQDKHVMDIVEVTSREVRCPLLLFGREFSGKLRSSDLRGVTFDFCSGAAQCDNLFVPLAGDHQFLNACVAIKAAMTAMDAPKGSAVCDIIQSGLSAVRWPGRLETIDRDPLVLLDGAHNPDAARTLAEFVSARLSGYRIVLVFGIMGDKDIGGVLGYLMPVADEIITCAPRSGRAATPGELAVCARAAGFKKIRTASSVGSALGKAKEIAGGTGAPPSGNSRTPLILVTGSLYTVGEVRELYGEKPTLGGLHESP